MATVDNQLKPSVQMLGTEVVKAEAEVNFANVNLASADQAGILTLPAGARVIALTVDVKTAEGSAGTFDLGIRGGTSTQFINGDDINAENVTHSTTPDYLNTSGAEEILELDASIALGTAVVQVICIYAVSELTFS